MGIFKKNSKIATTDVSTKKSDDDMYNSACLNVAVSFYFIYLSVMSLFLDIFLQSCYNFIVRKPNMAFIQF